MDASDNSAGGVRRPRPTLPTFPERKHLPHLGNVCLSNPLYFLTCCVAERRPILANEVAARTIVDAFKASPRFHRWHVGRYVIMPDHIHFFARPEHMAKTLAEFMRDWKKWTATCLVRGTQLDAHLWQREYFDHVLRSANSYSEKWDYVRENPVRAGLVKSPDKWPYSGECETLTF